MYKLLKVDKPNGAFIELESMETISECKSFIAQTEIRKENEMIIFTYEPEDGELGEEIDRKLMEVLKENNGNILYFSKGMQVSPNPNSRKCCGEGNCFCFVEGSNRVCRAQYCNASGICAWIACGIPCNC